MRVEQVHTTIVTGADPALPLHVGPVLHKLSVERQGRLLRPNVPDGAPPELPRMAIQLKDAVLQVGNSRIEFITRPPQHVSESYESSMEFCWSSATSLFGEVLSHVPKSISYDWTAVISTINFPRFQGQDAERAKPMSAILTTADELLKLDLDGRSHLAGFELNVAYERAGHYVNYRVYEYAVKEAVVKVGGPVAIDVEQIPTAELGIGLAIDVNSRPSSGSLKAGPVADLKGTLGQHKEAFNQYSRDLGLNGGLL